MHGINICRSMGKKKQSSCTKTAFKKVNIAYINSNLILTILSAYQYVFTRVGNAYQVKLISRFFNHVKAISIP